ncbi:recombinase family protein [Roseomonas sp. HJA6]|uniref:Recombinase family protein n=1 Tax=Roseomonas alba TaxID=2846776 RepID=A0ABS7A8L0_9PROT|nr:recombinase family protein [Neoroseomonas alba]
MATPRTFISYLRVSTARQGRSGLGIEAQQAAIGAFLRPGDHLLTPPYVEVESGRKEDRPELAKALARCRATGATLLIAKLDRLARDAHFLLGLQKSGVEFIACDLPNANRLTIGILAMVAEEEARAISARTKAALAAAKARGKVLGGVRPGQRVLTAEDSKRGAEAGVAVRQRNADHAAHRVLPRIEALRAEGGTLASIAASLAAEGIPTPRGGAGWTATAVRRVLLRVGTGAA